MLLWKKRKTNQQHLQICILSRSSCWRPACKAEFPQVRPSGLLIPGELVLLVLTGRRSVHRQQTSNLTEHTARLRCKKKKSDRYSPPDMCDKCFVQEPEGMLCFLGKNVKAQNNLLNRKPSIKWLTKHIIKSKKKKVCLWNKLESVSHSSSTFTIFNPPEWHF